MSLINFMSPGWFTHFSISSLNSQQNVTQLSISLFLEHSSGFPGDNVLTVFLVPDCSSPQLPNVEVHRDWFWGSLLFFIISFPLEFKYHIYTENFQIYFQLGLLFCCCHLPDIFLQRHNRILKLNVSKMKSQIFPFYQTYFYNSLIYHRKMHYYLAIA